MLRLPSMLAAFVLTAATAAQPLSGPSTTTHAHHPTVLHFDFAGRVQRPEQPVEAAAAALLALDAPTRARVQAILDRRAATLDDLIGDNLDLLIQLQGAEAAGKARQVDLLMRAWQRMKPLRDQGPLRTAIRAELPSPAAAEFDRLLDEYWAAVVREVHSHPGDDGKTPARLQVVIGEQFQSLGREIARSFERMLKSGDLVYAYISKDLGLNEKQQAKVRTLINEFVEKHGDNAGGKQLAWLVVQVLAELEPKQRVEVVRRLRKL